MSLCVFSHPRGQISQCLLFKGLLCNPSKCGFHSLLEIPSLLRAQNEILADISTSIDQLTNMILDISSYIGQISDSLENIENSKEEMSTK
jgi:hypothetical protein